MIYNMCTFGESGLYREWKAKLNVQALRHFTNPDEVFRTVSPRLLLFFFTAVALCTLVYWWIYKKWIAPQSVLISSEDFFKRVPVFIISLLIVTTTWLVIIRGGIGHTPIQSSDSYFCTIPVVNDASVNPLWNISFEFMYYYSHGKENPFRIYTPEAANAIIAKAFKVEKDTTEFFLNSPNPNIVFIILESWSTRVVKSFGGDHYAPYIDSLSKQGIRFANFYPAGYTSDQGIVAILSGYPCTSRMAIINQTSKATDIPCLSQDLKKKGYQSGFIFGGDINYGNIRSYLYNKNWDYIKDEKDFPASLEHGALGIQDMDMYKEFIVSLNAAKPPFMYAWFTASTHMPYDFKGEKKKYTNVQNDYVNAIVYSDNALRQFFKEAKYQPWYSNTLFVICSDHSWRTHKQEAVYSPEYHHIPMIFFGEVIKPEYKGKEEKAIHSQVDIAPTLLYQLGMANEARQYVWGKNMFNPYSPHFAYYCSYGSGGIVSSDGIIAYQHDNPKPVYNTVANNKLKTDSLTKLTKAYQQKVYEDFMNR